MATPELHKRTGHTAKLTDPECESQPASQVAVLHQGLISPLCALVVSF